MNVGIVVPHIFMQDVILPNVIFAPGELAISLAENINSQGAKVYLFTPGKIQSRVDNVNADLSLFEKELELRSDAYLSLLKKHPFTFVTLARQVQSELITNAYEMANDNELDIVHIYTNEEDIALPFAKLCNKPVVFTHHDPFNFLVKYKSLFPKYPQHNWISMSFAQRKGMPTDTNWVGNIYHGLEKDRFVPEYSPKGGYVAYLGRIISSKGVHLAIKAVQLYNKNNSPKIKLKIAGKHYSDHEKDTYWQQKVLPELHDPAIEYLGYIKNDEEKQKLLSNARALLVPSVFEEPFGIVMIESLACATPIIGLDSGAIPEVIKHGSTGFIIPKNNNEQRIISDLANAIEDIDKLSRRDCREDFERRFTAVRMAEEHIAVYEKLLKND